MDNFGTKTERIGEININNNGKYKMKIIEYINEKNIIVQFQDKYGAIVHTNYHAFIQGKVKNPFHPYVYNVGYIGEYSKKINNKKDKQIYKYWASMLKRCYDKNFLKNHPTYQECSVCKEWHNFTNFRKWYIENSYNINERITLDKDILIKGNKIYSPNTCLLVPVDINSLFIYLYDNKIQIWKSKRNKQTYYIVKYEGKRYKFETKEQALNFKIKTNSEKILYYIEKYKTKIPNSICEILYLKSKEIGGVEDDTEMD